MKYTTQKRRVPVLGVLIGLIVLVLGASLVVYITPGIGCCNSSIRRIIRKL